MEEYIRCPHCHRPLGEPDGPRKMALMCPYCQKLFAMEPAPARGAREGRDERRKASEELSKGPFPLILAERRRPLGLALLGVLFVLVGILGVIGALLVEAILLMSLGGTEAGQGQIAAWGARLREAVSVGEVAYGHEIAVGAVAVLFALVLWSAAAMLRRREWGRVLVALIHFVGLIGGGFLLGYAVIVVGVGDGRLVWWTIGFLFYCLLVSVYLGQKKVRAWFA